MMITQDTFVFVYDFCLLSELVVAVIAHNLHISDIDHSIKSSSLYALLEARESQRGMLPHFITGAAYCETHADCIMT